MEILAEKFERLEKSLRKSRTPLLIVHPKPDTDALGSVFSLYEYIKESHPENQPKIFSIDKPRLELEELFPTQKIDYKYKMSDHDLFIFLDRVDLYYKLEIDSKIEKLKKPVDVLGIDHHANSYIPDSLVVLDTKASATSEILYRFFDHVEFSYDKKVAQYLLNGIYDDTGGFRHDNTSPLSLEISGNLMRKGASVTKINRILYSNKSISTLKLWGIALDRAQVNPKTGMAVSFITKADIERCGATPHDLDGLSEILNTISGSKFSLVLSEREQNKIRASLRSERYKKIDVSKIAREFKGGGHTLASGFEIKGRLRQVGDSWIIE